MACEYIITSDKEFFDTIGEEETKKEETEKTAETTTGSNNEEKTTTIGAGFDDESNTKAGSKTTRSTAQTIKTNHNTESPKELPQAGSRITSVLILAGVLALVVIGIKVYRKNK